MNRHHLERKIGETVSLKLELEEEDFANVSSVTSSIKSVDEDYKIMDGVDHDLEVSEDAENHAYFIFLNGTSSDALSSGIYAIDVKIVIGVEVIMTDTIFYEFMQGVT